MNDIEFLECLRKMPLMELPVRTSVVTLKNAKVMISPGSKLTKDDLKRAGDITDIVAPCTPHCGGMSLAHEVFPKARLWGPAGVRQEKPEIPWTDELTEQNWPYNSELKAIELLGIPRNREFAFIHKKSKYLIVADLFFNMTQPKGLGSWLFLKMFGTYNKFAMSRLFASFIKDREAFKVSAQRILEEDFEHIAVGHGALFHGGPKDVLKAFAERGFSCHLPSDSLGNR